MSLEITINNDIKAAMLAKNRDRLAALRAIKAAILLAKTAEGASKEDLSDDEVIKIIQKLIKQRRESAEIYFYQNRPELGEIELVEVREMETYLPAQLSEAELEDNIKKIIEQTQASGMKDMGKVMGLATKTLSGKSDGKAISSMVKKLLQ